MSAYVQEMHRGEDDLLTPYCFQRGKAIELKEEVSKLLDELLQQKPRVVKKEPHPSGGLTYPSFVVSMCLELLALGVWPSMIGPPINAVGSSICPQHDVDNTFQNTTLR